MRYLDVQKQLESEISDYSDHQLLASERMLALKFHCSRETLRKALENLRNEGKIFKNKNIGWLVNRKKINYNLQTTQSFNAYVTEQGFIPSTQIISSQITYVDTAIAQQFNSSTNDLRFIEIIRLRFINDIPVVLEYNYLPYPNFAEVLNFDLNQSLVEIIETHFALKYDTSQLWIKNSNISELAKDLLRIPPHQSAIKIERINKSKDQVIEFDIEIWRDDKVELQLDINSS
ncbi:GntR family transcriptional regulator [Acinetobacter qingfengensis]|uniref:UbiC transcription regulator-associated domain-containing protein n=1 Tax=Acinetobacter qingfengensis TaxID=1262585 RepID=A0A1E7R364_9GAMM|nr:GntR family transcriptional regulator [Acinetobacter qingfengensis]KAA8733745.1 GntR family transcriptional regulator [Acinetobacter qingfengensis]OEY93744.1 hypothetical protein BJI46_04700 [Acinetobacter qingfengensis]